MRRLTLSAAAATAALAVVLPVAGPAGAATPPLKFGTFRADPAGNDLPMSTAKLNAEFIVVTNTTSRAIVLTGYKVYDAGRKHTYAFPKGYTLGARKSVTLRTGSGRTTATNAYWGKTNTYVWNNTGDAATLINARGAKVHACTYKPVSSGTKAC
ncbi:lamin tail domain-containing protein [Knoellia sp. LjRoot47]|uniref:lamin tail domain-containing protein n=1 Tax=Knoellia sp. LjRoot47 TaxID=3342330 RepID=UPI003ED08A40